jgi:long-chain acyl-CoA synthetase
MTLNKLLLSSFTKYNTRIFSQNKTYYHLFQDINKYRSFLQKRGVIKGDHVALVGNNSPNWAAMFYATTSLGAICVPMYRNYQASAKKAIYDEIKPKHIFDENFQLHEHHDTNEINDYDVQSEDSAVMLYTSGTTGKAKGVILTHKNLTSNLEAINTLIPENTVTQDDKYLSFLPWSHIYALNCELNYIISQGASVEMNKDPKTLLRDFQETNPTVLCAVPKLFQTIYSKINYAPVDYIKYSPFLKSQIKNQIFGNKFRFSTVGGASINEDILYFFDKLDINIYQGYGLTETSPLISLNVPNLNKIGSVGKILSCNEVHVIDKEICVKGDNVFKGYFGYEKQDNLFRTGDLGYIDKDGYLFIDGRKKEQYKLSNGKFVNPSHVEDILSVCPSIKQVMVCPNSSNDYNVALVVSDKNKFIIEEEINKVSHNLKKYEIPSHIVVIQEPFTIENGMLSQKLSLKRTVIMKKYNL